MAAFVQWLIHGRNARLPSGFVADLFELLADEALELRFGCSFKVDQLAEVPRFQLIEAQVAHELKSLLLREILGPAYFADIEYRTGGQLIDVDGPGDAVTSGT